MFNSERARFRDRADAGRQLAQRLADLRGRDVVVLGLPRGGVAVAFEVAARLDAPLDVVVARKLGAPQQPELAIGAIAPGASVLRDDVIEMLGITAAQLGAITAREQERATDLERRLRHGRPAADVQGRIAVIVDDGLATGATATAAARSVRARSPERVVLAVPVAPPESVADLAREVDEVVALIQPFDFHAVGLWYEEFPQLTDDEVRAMLDARA
ncbi:MAG: phosphoribosyltransferase [Chloroflexi bacterium]|nr:phosphoribosyltransferase [Chloroflexota bacterium]